jgi:hypothetical protein
LWVPYTAPPRQAAMPVQARYVPRPPHSWRRGPTNLSRGPRLLDSQGQWVHVLVSPATSVASQGTSPPTAHGSCRHLRLNLALLQHKRWFVLQP